MKKWKVRFSGRLERMLIFYIALLMLVLWQFPGVIAEVDSENFVIALFIVLFFGWPFITVTANKLIKSKIAREIQLDMTNNNCQLVFSKKNVMDIPFDQLAYAVVGNHKSHFALTIYKTYIGSRGQTVFTKATEIIGLRVTFSWKVRQITEIANELEILNIEKIKASNKDLPLWERIISN